jgi:hypothetical protein
MHDDQFTATGPPLASSGAGFPESAFSTLPDDTGFQFGLRANARRCGVVGQTDGGGVAGVYGHGRFSQFGVLGTAFGQSTGVVGVSVVNTNDLMNLNVPPANVSLDSLGAGSGTGIFGKSGSGIGVHGDSDSNTGVFGSSNSGFGVDGRTLSGIGVHGDSDSNTGVFGSSNSGFGVDGRSRTGVGVDGASDSNTAVLARSNTGFGVDSRSNSNIGVYGESETKEGVYGFTQSGIGIRGATLSGSDTSRAASFRGPVDLGGHVDVFGNFTVVTGTKQFKIDHPLDPENKYLLHNCVESAEMKNVYDGTVRLDEDGAALVYLPEWFEALNEDFRYQLTAVGGAAPELHIASEISENRFRIAGGREGMKVCWQVTGCRKDPWALANPFEAEQEKPQRDRGRYLEPGLYNAPEEQRVWDSTRALASEPAERRPRP